MLKDMLIALIVSFAVTAAMGPFLIKVLHRLKFGQTVREDGPMTHLKKNGTPTMGGIMFLLGMTIASLVFVGKYPELLSVWILTIGFAAVGFLDDFIKVVLKRSLGLRAWQKFLIQIVITGIYAYYIIAVEKNSMMMRLPFSGREISAGVLTIPLLFFVVIGTDNGTNFTDGLDGLAATVTSIVAAFFAASAYITGSGTAIIAAAMIGGLLGYLIYNAYPAKVFMGDTGALALGGFVAGIAYSLHMPLYIPIVGFIYLFEVVSVILQVGYFKITKGKRIFKKAPIHHHFEEMGWSENRIVLTFGLITLVLSVICLFSFL